MSGNDQFSDALKALGELGCCFATWKSVSGETVKGIDIGCQLHRSPLCLAVKQIAGNMVRCRRDDVERVRGRGLRSGAFFLKRCHACVIELVVPVREGDLLVGSYQFGPWRLMRGIGAYRACGDQYGVIPLFDRRRARLLMRAVRALALPVSGGNHNPKPPVPEPLNRALVFIDRHYAEPLTRQSVADASFVSQSRLSHLFREHLSMSLTDHIISLRMRAAMTLLRGTSLKLGTVAARVGYDNPSYFSSLFRRETGKTAGEFRRDAWQGEEV